MMRFFFPLLIITLAGLIAVADVRASGEFGPELAEFHKHIDDYQAEVERLIGQANAVAATYRDGGDAKAAVQALIDSWEDVGVHGAIETRATILYPTIWQAIVGLMQAIENDAGHEPVQVAANTLGGALWQGFGGVRLAAFQVEQGQTASAPPAAPEGDYGEQIAHIRDSLERAVEAYADGDLRRAEALIHDAYMKRFEFLEGDLIGKDAGLVEDLEMDFNARLPRLMQQGAKPAEVRAKLDDMLTDLDRAAELLARADADRPEVF